MPRRITPLRLPAAWGASWKLATTALLLAALAASEAQAHRLDAQLFVLPNRKIQVESWFSNGDAAKGAKVQVFGAQEQLLSEGHLNEQGVFVFSYGEAVPRTVVITAEAGHRKELTLSASVLTRALAPPTMDTSAGANEVSPAPVPLAERDATGALKDTVIGIGFLLAVAAFVLSLRNAQKLRALGRPSEKTR